MLWWTCDAGIVMCPTKQPVRPAVQHFVSGVTKTFDSYVRRSDRCARPCPLRFGHELSTLAPGAGPCAARRRSGRDRGAAVTRSRRARRADRRAPCGGGPLSSRGGRCRSALASATDRRTCRWSAVVAIHDSPAPAAGTSRPARCRRCADSRSRRPRSRGSTAAGRPPTALVTTPYLRPRQLPTRTAVAAAASVSNCRGGGRSQERDRAVGCQRVLSRSRISVSRSSAVAASSGSSIFMRAL